MKYRLIAVMFTSKCVLLLAIAFAPCQLRILHVIMITGVFQKDGNTLPFTGEEKLEDHPAAKHFQDVCIKLKFSISSGTGVPFNTIACGFSYLTGQAESNHVIVTMENIGSADVNKFVRELLLKLKTRTNSDKSDSILGRNYAIRIGMEFVGDDLTGEWRGTYGSATEVMHIAETMCAKYERMEKAEETSGDKNFTCVVKGPHWAHLEGEFLLHFESDEADNITVTKKDLEKRNNTRVGYDITDLQIKLLCATR
ncbi:unnamed protein product [Dicrocoelium dendriticum]|nr:unnamed protein product [Dicrocoelium dendriticum]